ncbi:MAG: ABC transporter permease [Spirochaetales bacterium]|nr:ABC transporter permease [Spirochaetales bacterium]
MTVLKRIILLGLVIGVILPMIPLFVWAFSGSWFYPSLLPQSLSLRSWSYVFHPGSRILEALFNSFFIAASVTILSLIVGVPAGKAIGMYRFKGKTIVEIILLSPALIPSMTVTMGMQVLFIRYGLSETLMGVILVHLIPTIPYMTVSMSAVFSHFDISFEEQARSLGAKSLSTFRHVTLPAVFPGMVVGAMFSFLISWGQYVLTLMVGGGRIVTLPLLLYSFAVSGDNSLVGALSLVFIIPSLVILVLSSRFLTGESSGMGGFGGV